MFGEGMPWSLLLPIATLVFLAGINAGKRSAEKFKEALQKSEDENINDL